MTSMTEDVVMAPPPANKENQPKNAAGSSTTTGEYKSPWVEAYRPRTLADVLGNEETVTRLQAIAQNGNLPNLILCGPPGTGAYGPVGFVDCGSRGSLVACSKSSEQTTSTHSRMLMDGTDVLMD